MSDPERGRGDDRREDRRDDRDRRDDGTQEDREPRGDSGIDDSVELVATSTVRVGFLALGFLILLYAVGQIVGVNVLGTLSAVLDSHEVRWMIIAFFGVVLITLALRGFRARQTP